MTQSVTLSPRITFPAFGASATALVSYIDADPFSGEGEMVAHFAPDLWYIKIGEPDNRVELSLADWFNIDAYLMVGQELPPPPPLPPEVTDVLGELYRVVAVDTRYNQSAPSAILALRRPDVVPT